MMKYLLKDTDNIQNIIDETTQNMLQDGQEKLNYFLWSEYIHFGVSFISLLYNILICSCGSKKYKYE